MEYGKLLASLLIFHVVEARHAREIPRGSFDGDQRAAAILRDFSAPTCGNLFI